MQVLCLKTSVHNFLLANHQQINHPKCSGSEQLDLLTLVVGGGRYLDNSFLPTLMHIQKLHEATQYSSRSMCEQKQQK